MKPPCTFIVLTLICGIIIPPPALAQSDKLGWYTDRFTYFYKDPRPERLPGLIEKWQIDSGGRWESYPPLVGFLAVVFKDHPSWIDRLIPSKLTPSSATAIAGALRLAGDPVVPAEVRSRIVQAGVDPILKKQLAGLPAQLGELKITLPTHLDILWGATFASGDDRYVLKIIDFFATIANQSNPVALDIGKIAANYLHNSRETTTALRNKYGDHALVQMVFAATALWALSSNAKQHAFIQKTLVTYTSNHLDSPAAHAIIVAFPQIIMFLDLRQTHHAMGR